MGSLKQLLSCVSRQIIFYENKTNIYNKCYYCEFIDFLVSIYRVLLPVLQCHKLIQLKICGEMSLGIVRSWIELHTGLWGHIGM